MIPKHRQWGHEYASIFKDASVVRAYPHRPPYPPRTFEILAGLIPEGAEPRTVLDAGSGTGCVARNLLDSAERVDAVDFSPAMIEAGRALPGGADPRLRWICAPMEQAPLDPPYALVVAAASLHWMEWEIVMPRFRDTLRPGGYLALVEEQASSSPWEAEVKRAVAPYSMNRDFEPYDMLTVARELELRGLFRQVGVVTTPFVPFRQSVDGLVESLHARNGFSRDRMDPEAARECDRLMRQVIRRHCPEGFVERRIAARIIWGRPGPERAGDGENRTRL